MQASSCEDVDAGLGLTGIGRMPSSEPEGPSNSGPACAPLRPRLIRCSASSVALPLLHSLCAQHTSRPHTSSCNKTVSFCRKWANVQYSMRGMVKVRRRRFEIVNRWNNAGDGVIRFSAFPVLSLFSPYFLPIFRPSEKRRAGWGLNTR